MQPSEAVQLGAVTEACSSKAKIFADSAPAATAVKAGCQAGRLRITKNKQIFPGCVRPGHLQLSGPKVLQTLHLQQFSILAPAQLHLAALPQLFSNFYLLHRHPIPPLIWWLNACKQNDKTICHLLGAQLSYRASLVLSESTFSSFPLSPFQPLCAILSPFQPADCVQSSTAATDNHAQEQSAAVGIWIRHRRFSFIDESTTKYELFLTFASVENC